MTPELTQRLKSACKLMAEKMPEKLTYQYNPEFEMILLFQKGTVDCFANFSSKNSAWLTQDALDLLLSLLPEPRRALLELELDDDDIPHHLNGILLDDKFTWIDTYYLTNTLDKKEALAETVIYETFKQLGGGK